MFTRVWVPVGVVALWCLAPVAPAFRPAAAQAFRPASQSATTTAHATYTETIPGTTVTFDMVAIPGGTFTMGSPASEKGREPDEGPAHQVRIAPLWIGKTEVTWDEYDTFAFAQAIPAPPGSSPAATPPPGADAVTRPTPPYGDESFSFGKGRQPAINVQIHAAMEYCRWLSLKTGKIYRLATEAEWEYAARAGTTGAYSFGEAATIDAHAWHAGNSEARPRPVGQKAPNPWGLHDMHGNVAEWTLDLYDPTQYASVPPNALGPVLLPTDRRYPYVARGGSWDDPVARLRSAARRGSNEEWNRRDPQSPQSIWWHTDAAFVGFRIVRAVEEQENLKGLRSKIAQASR